MPWSPKDAASKTRKADSPAERKTWSKVANRTLRDTGDEGRAVRIANYVVKRNQQRRARRSSR
jgi:hypothetical protein